MSRYRQSNLTLRQYRILNCEVTPTSDKKLRQMESYGWLADIERVQGAYFYRVTKEGYEELQRNREILIK